MNYSARYPTDMDWVRKRLILDNTASIYEVCVKMVEEIKSLDELLKQSLLKGRTENERPAKRKPGRPRKSS